MQLILLKTGSASNNSLSTLTCDSLQTVLPAPKKKHWLWPKISVSRLSFALHTCLGGQAMEIVHNLAELERYINTAVKVSGDTPVLLDHYLKSAIELDVDALCDGEDVYVSGIMEHIEEAGCSLQGIRPAYCHHTHYQEEQSPRFATRRSKLAKALNVKGLMNVQYAVQKDEATDEDIIFIIEVNPRASRTVPFVAKATGVPVAKAGRARYGWRTT